MNKFKESGLEFQFDSNWFVFKFDKHRFYQYLSGQGLKGVDFLAVNWEKDQIVLLEVKNFAPSDWSGQIPTLELVLENPSDYAKGIIKKFEDSIRLFKIINDYYQEKWWINSWGSIFKTILPQKRYKALDFLFWPAIHQKLQNQESKITLLLFLQWQEGVNPVLEANFQNILSQKITTHFSKEAFSFHLINKKNPFPSITVNS